MVLLACATTLPQNYLMNNVNKWKDVFRGFVVMWNTWRWEQRRMDALAHMLSDPLDPKEENDEQITEECMLGNCRVSLPEDLLEDVSCLAFSCEIILISAVSRFIFCFTYLHMLLFTSFYDSLKFSSLCWVKALGVKYWQIPSGSTFVSFCRSFLRTIVWSRTVPSVTYSIIQFLTLGTPFILHKNYSEVLTTLLLRRVNDAELIFEAVTHHISCYPNPDGYFNPEVVKYRQLCAKSQRKRQVHCLQQYYHRLLKQILVSRKVFVFFKFVEDCAQPLSFCLCLWVLMYFLLQELLDFAVQNGLDFPHKRRLPTKTHAEMREARVTRRLSRIMKEVKAECGDSNASSDDDGLSGLGWVFLMLITFFCNLWSTSLTANMNMKNWEET